jgi:predicted nucleic acid-binding protein
VTWLIDTNIISEIRKGRWADPMVVRWWDKMADQELFLSVLTLGEIRQGQDAIRPRNPTYAATLAVWLADIIRAVGPRVLPIDGRVADIWGRMSGRRTVPVIDGLPAATAIAHDLVLVTRNISDVDGLGAQLLNPFAPY